MPFFFVFVGALLILTGIKDTYVALGNELQKDFTGSGNFFVWVMALGSIGALGYVQQLRPFTNAFMLLILIAMVLSNSNRGDILTMIGDGLNNPVTPPRPQTSATPSSVALPRADLAGNNVEQTNAASRERAFEAAKLGAKLFGF